MTAVAVRAPAAGTAPISRRAWAIHAAAASTSSGEQLFDKILVANRGEIACRVHRSAKALGIKSVAVYSDPDASAVHVRDADEAVCVGPAASDASYLNIPAIIDAIKSTGAQAVHPGYGFLSENAAFAKELDKIGVAFIGPGEYAIDKMGDKIASKLIAMEAGVNTIPGYAGLVETDEEVIRISNEIGYPVMIKASAGGGGKGMRIAHNDEEAKMGFRLSKDEALSSFGDDRIFIEKFIEEPRHIEIQILADKHGNVIALPERECSIQRRNQKVLEESPSVLLDPETRAAMGKQACMLAKAVNYESAGTVEFLCDKHKNFYFLEMNTRLQVEHPVSEAVSGIDLVEQMIRIAAGHPLPAHLLEGPIPIHGWSMEARIYAEDPVRGFLPSTGTLSRYTEPPTAEGGFVGAGYPERGVEGDGVRVDAGVREGSNISMFYDPMICKLVSHGKDRNEALQRLKASLDKYVIHGVENNVSFVRDVCTNPRYVDGALTTGFIDEEYPEGFSGVVLPSDDRLRLAATAAIMHTIKTEHNLTISGGRTAPSTGPTSAPVVVSLDQDLDTEQHVQAVVTQRTDGGSSAWDVELTQDDGSSTTITFDAFNWRLNAPTLTVKIQGESEFGDDGLTMQLRQPLAEGFRLQLRGAVHDVSVRTPRRAELAKLMPEKQVLDTSAMLVSPMPGMLVSLAVSVGDVVEEGQELAVVEAMKMANVLRSARKGVVKAIPHAAGSALAVDDIIIEFETEEDAE